MSTLKSRRRFVFAGLTAGVGVLFGTSALAQTATASATATASSAPLTAKEIEILSGLRRLFPKILLNGVEEGSKRSVKASACIDNFHALLDPARRSEALPNLPIRAEGDSIHFEADGTRFEVSMLLPGDFSRQFGNTFTS